MIGLGRVRLWWRNRGIDRAHLRHRLEHESAYQPIEDVITRFHEGGGLEHRFQAYKLFELNMLLERYRPSRILELGSGSSTAIFARYVMQDDRRRLTSIDESEKWLSNARSLAGVAEEDRQFEWVVAKPVASESGARLSIGYGLQNGEFDFVFIDGPSLRINGIQRKDAVNDDVFRLLDTNPPSVIVVDARYATMRAISQATTGSYQAMPSDLLKRFPQYGYRYFSVFCRNDSFSGEYS